MLGGYLIGVVAGPDSPVRTTGTVESYDTGSSQLCLTGDDVADLDAAEDDRLCGTWQRAAGSRVPSEGDRFRFVHTVAQGQDGPEDDRVLIVGEVDD